jgi:hypothetical protein
MKASQEEQIKSMMKEGLTREEAEFALEMEMEERNNVPFLDEDVDDDYDFEDIGDRYGD